MRTLLLTLFVGIVALIWAPGSVWAASSSVKSYRVWKNEKISQARHKLNQRKSVAGSLRKQQKPEVSLENDEMELEAARDLTVADYFVGYLAKVPGKNVYKEAATRLSDDEVAELMAAYANTVFGAQNARISPSALNWGADVAK